MNINPSIQNNYRLFFEVHRAGSISKAAAWLDQDQGNVSRGLLQLEKSLGVKLFFRHRNGVEPTSEGQNLYRYLEETNQAWEQFTDSKSLTERPLTLSIGLHPSLAHSHLAKFFALELEQTLSSKVQFIPQLMPSLAVTKAIGDRRLDLGLVVNAVRSKDIIIHRIDREEVYLAGIRGQQFQEAKILLRNSEMVHFHKLKTKRTFRRIIDCADYELMARLASQNESLQCIVPATTLQRYRNLDYLEKVGPGVAVQLLTHPGALPRRLFSQIARHLKASLLES